MTRIALLPALLFVLCFSLATFLHPRQAGWGDEQRRGGSIFNVLLGDGRKLFANHFFAKADVYFHRGNYPTIFDQAVSGRSLHMAEAGFDSKENAGSDEAGHGHEGHQCGGSCGHPEHEASAARKPDWIERFGRRFYPSEHTHMAGGGEERELLPWLRLSAEMDPHRIQTYTVASYWLRTRLGKVDEAEEFLRHGLRANPGNPEILFELGRLYYQNRADYVRARNVLELALIKWRETSTGEEDEDDFLYQQILGNLARVEEQVGNLAQARAYLEQLKLVSPVPEVIQGQIDEITQTLAAPAPAGSP